MGLDARIRYTKMVIQTSFLSLLKQKPLNKITVKEICEMAEINRATFYKYYSDAYDLMEKIESDILRGLQETVQRSLKDGAYKTLLQILESMKENGEPYITLFSGNGDVTFPAKIFQLCYAEMSAHIESQFPTLSKTQQAWAYVYVAQGSSGILQEWIADGMEEPPEQVADFIEKLISGTIFKSKTGGTG